jgi:hypothetical protein
LFRDPANLRSFVDDPDHALQDPGLPDATPEQVHELLPMVAESMPHIAEPDPAPVDDAGAVAWGKAIE